MPSVFEIHSIKVGEIDVPHGSGTLCDPVYCWLADDGRTRVLVDSGMPDAQEVQRSLRVVARGGGQEALRRGLRGIGLRPEDIDLVVPTHLHFDHGSNLELFPRACVVLQREELLHAVDPSPTQRIYYRRDALAELIGRKRPTGLRLVDGDTHLLDGLLLLKVPSHTPGFQVPLVTTERGIVALASDLGEHYRNWFPADPRANHAPMRYLSDTFLPNTIRTESERDYVDAMRRVIAGSDIVVPSHDSRIPRHIPQEWFAVPDAVVEAAQTPSEVPLAELPARVHS